MKINLESRICEVKNILKNTNAEHFRNIEIGNKLQFSYELNNFKSYGAMSVIVTNITKNEKWTIKENNLKHRIECFELIQ